MNERAKPAADGQAPEEGRGEPGQSGRFPTNGMASLVGHATRFDLAVSTVQDLSFGGLLDLLGQNGATRTVSLGYAPAGGQQELRDAIGNHCGIPGNNVLVTQGATLAMFLLAFEHCRTGDEVVLVSPCFPPARDCLLACDLMVREVALSFDTGYRMNLDQLAMSLSPKTRLVSLASPANPTGVRTPDAEIRKLLDLMALRSPRAKLFIDETYRDATYENVVPQSAARLDDRIVVAGSLSKAYGIPGLRLGWLASSDPDLMPRLTVAKFNIVNSTSSLDEALALVIMQQPEAVLAPVRSFLSATLEAVASWQERERWAVDWVRPDGGALCCMRLTPARFGDAEVDQFWSLLPRAGIRLAPGTWFGERKCVFRLGFGSRPLPHLESALCALSDVLTSAGVRG